MSVSENKGVFRNASDRIKAWWRGAARPVEEDNGFIFLNLNPKRHWTSKIAHSVADFIGREWKWVIGTGLVVAGLIIAASKKL